MSDTTKEFTKLKAGGRFAIYALIVYSAATLTIGCLGLIIGSPLLALPLAMLISHPVIWIAIGIALAATYKVVIEPLYRLVRNGKGASKEEKSEEKGVEKSESMGSGMDTISTQTDLSGKCRNSCTSSDNVSEISSPIDTPSYDENYGSQDLTNQTQAGNYDYLLQQVDVARLASIVQGLDPQVHEIIGSNDQLKKQLSRFKNEIESSNETKKLIFIINLRNGHWVTLCVNYYNNQLSAYYYDSLNGKEDRSTFTTILKEELNMDESNIRFFNDKTQNDGSNCGIFALEAAGRINQALDKGVLLNDIDQMLSEFKPTADELRTLRDQLAQILSNNQPNNEFVVTNLTPSGNNGLSIQ